MSWVTLALSAALSWGLYGASLHRGQTELGNPMRARPDHDQLVGDLGNPASDQAMGLLLGAAKLQHIPQGDDVPAVQFRQQIERRQR